MPAIAWSVHSQCAIDAAAAAVRAEKAMPTALSSAHLKPATAAAEAAKTA